MANLQNNADRAGWRTMCFPCPVKIAGAWLTLFLAAHTWMPTEIFGQTGPALSAPAASAEPAPLPAAAGPSPTDTLAAASSNDMVVDVKIAGNKSLPISKILPSIQTRAGRPFDKELIEEDVRRLDRTKQFINVKTYLQKVPGGRVVYFEVFERPQLSEVLFVGCKQLHKRRLQKEADLKAGDPADPNTVEEARRKIEDYYHTRGFPDARVVLLEGDKIEDRRAIFLINESTKQCVWSTKFIGNTIASGDRLQTQIGSKHPFLYLFGGEFDSKKLDEDVEKLTAYYRGLGFFRARIGREVSFNEKNNWVTITFVIDEGQRYKIRNVSVLGATKYSDKELKEELKLTGGEFFNQAKMTVDVRTLQDKYGSVGYVFADVKPDPRFLEEPGQLDLVYNITEGDRYRVGKVNIVIKGEYSHTQENTVRNRLSFKPGDIVDIREIRDSERRLRACGLFESNPAQGNAPKIVFSPPDQDGKTPEEDEHQSVAGKPHAAPGMGGFGFRGQSPDGGSQDRELNLTLDCGQIVVPPDQMPVEKTITKTSDCRAIAGGQRPAATGAQQPAESGENSLFQMARNLARTAAETNPAQRSRDGLIPTQYSPDAGQTNPATSSSLRWTPIAPVDPPSNSAASATVPVNPYRTSANTNSRNTTAPLYVASQPQPTGTAAGAAAATSGNNNSGTTTAPMPATSAPAYGNDMTPGIGPPREIVSPNGVATPSPVFNQNSPIWGGQPDPVPPLRSLDLNIRTEETMTGRLMFGVGVNSDAGLVGSVVLDEQNFDWTRIPSSWEEVRNSTAFRGAGQRFRIEAVPGTTVQRYAVTFQEPYLFDSQVSLGLSGYFYNRIYNEYDEQRVGGRVAFGYQLTHDWSVSAAYRGAKINITDPIDPTIPDLAEVTGRNLALHGFGLSTSYDKRDNPFMATQGHVLEASIEQVLGSFQYPRMELDAKKYFTLHERPDGSGRHVLSVSGHAGWSGDDTPIYDRFYAGGFSTIRGFQFRGASPHVYSVSAGEDAFIGGNFELLASVEYLFPITADDMVRGVVFCDTGTVEPTMDNWSNNYRVSPGFGLRICVPAMGPAPIALDFAFPVAWQPGDQFEMFSFFVGFQR